MFWFLWTSKMKGKQQRCMSALLLVINNRATFLICITIFKSWKTLFNFFVLFMMQHVGTWWILNLICIINILSTIFLSLDNQYDNKKALMCSICQFPWFVNISIMADFKLLTGCHWSIFSGFVWYSITRILWFLL